MAAASLVVAAHLPLILAVRQIHTGGFWSPAEASQIVKTYVYLLAPLILPAVSLVFLWGGSWFSYGRTSKRRDKLLPEESAALAVYALLPVMIGVFALLVSKGYWYRYGSPVTVAISILIGLASARVAGERRAPSVVTALVLFAWFAGTRFQLAEPTHAVSENAAVIQSLTEEIALPVVVSSPLYFPKLTYYSPPELATRLVYPADPKWALETLGTDSPELTLVRLNRWAPLNVESYASFVRSNRDFIFCYLPNAEFDWIASRLRNEGREMEKLRDVGDLEIFRCCK